MLRLFAIIFFCERDDCAGVSPLPYVTIPRKVGPAVHTTVFSQCCFCACGSDILFDSSDMIRFNSVFFSSGVQTESWKKICPEDGTSAAYRAS